MCQSLQIRITGKVQGVWFRKYTYEKAGELGLSGFVKNQPDGSVYAEAQSNDENRLRHFVDWLHTGSPLSRVDQVSVSTQDCKPFVDFKIR